MSALTLIWVISAVVAYTLASPAVSPNFKFSVFYFPDPKNESGLIPAYLTGDSPSIEALNNSTISFYLLTKANKGNPELIVPYDKEGIRASNFVPNAPLKILAHGFGGEHTDGFPMKVAEAFLELDEDMNVILVDWEHLAKQPWYTTAAPATKLVGNTAGNLIQFLVDEGLVTLDKVHAIGYSLGGQVVGNIGHALGGKCARVTSLDPALPLFDLTGDDNRIDPSDAQFVEVIHSAGGFLHENGLAFNSPRGHADFYPNNGKQQPGCEGEPFGGCSHGRAPALYEESIRNKESVYACSCGHWDLFLAGKCDCSEAIHFGINSPSTARGKYFFLTNEKRPLGMGKEGLVAAKGGAQPIFELFVRIQYLFAAALVSSIFFKL